MGFLKFVNLDLHYMYVYNSLVVLFFDLLKFLKKSVRLLEFVYMLSLIDLEGHYFLVNYNKYLYLVS